MKLSQPQMHHREGWHPDLTPELKKGDYREVVERRTAPAETRPKRPSIAEHLAAAKERLASTSPSHPRWFPQTLHDERTSGMRAAGNPVSSRRLVLRCENEKLLNRHVEHAREPDGEQK